MCKDSQIPFKESISLLMTIALLFLSVKQEANAVVYASVNKVALIIGNESYPFSPLRNPVNDARDMAEALEQLGFEVILKTNLKYGEMRATIEYFGERLANKNGVALFFYAGHGMQIGGVNYLIPVDADIRFEKQVKYNSIDANFILSEMDNANNQINIIILDACRGNPFYRAFRSNDEGLSAMPSSIGSIIAYSTSPGKKAEDGIGRNSVYTASLLKEIKVPGKRLTEIFSSVRKTVRIQTGGAQVPWEATSLENSFYFIPPGSDAAILQANVVDAPKAINELTPITDQYAPGEEWIEPLTGIRMVWVPGGCYEMGCGGWIKGCEQDELPAHEVCVDGFWMSKYEITHEQFLIFINDEQVRVPEGQVWFTTKTSDVDNGRILEMNGLFSVIPDDLKLPMVNVSWFGAANFAEWLTRRTGKQFTLPSEAEWEYAARDRGKNIKFSGSDDAELVANLDGVLQPVGMKKPNSLGIHDLSGNVWEWQRDVYLSNAYSKHARMNPCIEAGMKNSADDAARVIRGGSFGYNDEVARNTNRGSHWINGVTWDLGFRMVMHPQPIIITRSFSPLLPAQF